MGLPEFQRLRFGDYLRICPGSRPADIEPRPDDRPPTHSPVSLAPEKNINKSLERNVIGNKHTSKSHKPLQKYH